MTLLWRLSSRLKQLGNTGETTGSHSKVGQPIRGKRPSFAGKALAALLQLLKQGCYFFFRTVRLILLRLYCAGRVCVLRTVLF